MSCFVLLIFNCVIMDGHPIFQSWKMARLKMGKTKHPIVYPLNNYTYKTVLFKVRCLHTCVAGHWLTFTILLHKFKQRQFLLTTSAESINAPPSVILNYEARIYRCAKVILCVSA